MSELMDQLVDINAVKSELKTKINANGGAISPSTPFKEYPDHIGVSGDDDIVIPDHVYERPADWLTLPTLVEGDQKMVGLYPVYEDVPNYLGILCGDDYTIDWGDGTIENIAGGVAGIEHEYDYNNVALDATLSTRGYKQVIVTVTPQSGYNLTDVRFNQRSNTLEDSMNRWLDIAIVGVNITRIYLGGRYYTSNMPLLERFHFVGESNLTSYTTLFQNCPSLVEVIFDNIINTSISLTDTFYGCRSLKTIRGIDYSKCISIRSAFRECHLLEKLDNFDISNVDNMSAAFYDCHSLKQLNGLKISNKLTIGYRAFYGCRSLVKFVGDIDFSNVSNLDGIFYDCCNLIEITSFNIAKNTTLYETFYGCRSLRDLSHMVWDCTSLENMYGTFSYCTSLRKLPTFNNVGNITNTYGCFQYCFSLIDTSKAVDLINRTMLTNTNVGNVFSNCYSLSGDITIDFKNKNLSVNSMFYKCYSINNVNFINFGNVVSMNSLFRECFALEKFTVDDTSSVTNMDYLFNECTSLKKCPNMDLSNVTTLGSAFYQTYNLKELDLSDAINCTQFTYVGYKCFSLRKLKLDFVKCSQVGTFLYDMHSIEDIEVDFTGSPLTTITNTLYNSRTVKRIIFTEFKHGNLSLSSNPMMRDAIIDLFNSLGTTTGGYTINLTNTPGVDTLTAADILIATNKGWTVTV